MKIQRILLCYETGDKIILDNDQQLIRFDLNQVNHFEVTAQVSREEFDKLREAANVKVENIWPLNDK